MVKVSRFGVAAKAAGLVRPGRVVGDSGRGGLSAWGWLAAALLLLCAALPWRPVEALCVQGPRGDVWRVPVPLGQAVVMRYIHSVERTPVEDVYYPLGGMLYQWRTRSRSHNAGLPWKAPEHGRFLTEEGWLVLEGGLPAWESIRLRVGTEALGHNELKVGSGDWMALYSRFPGKRLCLSAGRVPLWTVWHKDG